MFHKVLAVGLAAVLSAGCASRTVAPSAAFREFTGDLLVLVDTDMPAFAYANGVLEPRVQDPDGVLLLSGGTAPSLGPIAPASNTVTSWPGSLAVNPDGRHAYVIEGRQGAPAGVARVDSVDQGLRPGTRLTVLVRGADGFSAEGAAETAPLATGLSVSPEGRWLAVSTETPGSDLQIYELVDGRPGAPLTVDLPFDFGIGDQAGKLQGVAWHPSRQVLAVNLGGGGVGFVRLELDPSGKPVGAQFQGEPIRVGELLSGLRWSPDGRFLYALDTGWGPGRTDRIFNGDGAIHVIRHDAAGSHTLVGSTPSGLSSESFAISADGSRIATLNMERTYLPRGFPTGMFRGRSASSVSLFSVNRETGLPTRLGEPVRFRGVLPQGIAFDDTGRNLAVAVFQDHDAQSTSGWVRFFRIEGDGEAARLQPTDRKVPTPRGAHFLVRLSVSSPETQTSAVVEGGAR